MLRRWLLRAAGWAWRAFRPAGRPIALLRQRGVFRTEYTGRTLREHYGIPPS